MHDRTERSILGTYRSPPFPLVNPRGAVSDRPSQGYYGAATGKGRQSAKSELEKLDLAAGNLSLEQGVKEAARIIYVAHEDSKYMEFEGEMRWGSSLAGPTTGRHEEVPKALREEAERLAKKELDGGADEAEQRMEE